MAAVDNLLAEVNALASRRNHEVAANLLSRICNYQKAKLKLLRIEQWISVERKQRLLRVIYRFKSPCGRCPLCNP